MERKTFVLDTNVLLHDPGAVSKFGHNDVLIPLMVLEEINQLKRNPDILGKHSREILRYFGAIKEEFKGDINDGIDIPEGGRIRFYLQNHFQSERDFPLPLNTQSNKILLIAFRLKKQGENVVFVSKDFIARVKAEAMGLEAEDYENAKASYKNLYKGLRRIETSKLEIDTFYKDGWIVVESEEFKANEYCVLTCSEHSSAVCKYNDKTKRLEALMHLRKDIWGIQPLNVEQRCAIDLLFRDDIQLVTLVGPAGTGKTLIALACGMVKVFDDNDYSRMLISRPVVPLGQDIGYLPGTKEEKLFHWMQPIYDNLEFLCANASGAGNESSTMEWIMESKKIEMEAVTYIRGRTLPKIFMIIDEAQNLTPHEVKTIISRAGIGAKVILTGDPTQIDNPYLDKDSNGLTYTVSRFQGQPIYGHVFMEKTERSNLAAIAAKIM